jgi:fructokinase
VGTNSLVQPLAREAVVAAVARARRAGLITSCDPNLRLLLWPEPAVLKGLLDTLLGDCAVVKLSDEEIGFVTGTAKVDQALLALEARGVPLSVVTRGAAGASLRFRGRTFEVPAPKVRVVDTTGAGDGFTAGLLYGLSRMCRTRAELEAVPLSHLQASARLAVAVGSRAVTRLGAVAALPRARQVARLVRAVAAGPAVAPRRRARG